MDISQMRMTLALAESGSMTMTAKKLHVTQPALTYQLKVIENELGFKVFNRTRSGTTLTAEGAFLNASLKRIVEEYDETVRLARAMDQSGDHDAVRVGVNEASRDIVSLLLNMARSKAQFTMIPMGSADPIRLLREGVIDCWSASDAALRSAGSDFGFEELARVGQSVFVPESHALSKRATLQMDDLREGQVGLWPRGSASAAADAMRDELTSRGVSVADFERGVPQFASTPADGRVVVYDDGYLPLPAMQARQISLQDAPEDVLGLVYLPSNEKRVKSLSAALGADSGAGGLVVGQSELAAERIVSLLDEISSTVRQGRVDAVAELVESGLELGISAHHLLNRGLLPGMNAAGDAYRAEDADMDEMIAAVDTANLAMEVLKPHIALEDERHIAGAAVIGTVVGDIHDIGKNLVRIMLESRDIKVDDLGTEVPAATYVDYVRKNPDCNLVLISVNRTELRGEARAVVEALKRAKLRDQLFIMVGGAAADEELARQVGADAYTESAQDAADAARGFLTI